MSFPLLSDHAVRSVQQDASTGWPARPAGNGPVFYFGWTEPTGLQALDLWFPTAEPTADPVAPVITGAGTISGTPIVGTSLSVTGFTATGNPTPTLSYQWQRDGVNISGATSATYVLQAADDETDVRRVTTATNSEDSDSAPTAAVSVTYAAPVAGSLSAQVFEQATGVQTIATAGAFSNAEGGAYSVSTVAGVTIDSNTGVVSVDTADLLATTSVTVTYTNSGGSDDLVFDLTVQEEAPPVTTYENAVLADSPVVFLLGSEGGAWTDISGNELDATLTNATFEATGGPGSDLAERVVFNGSNAVAVIAHTAALNTTTAITIEAWVKRTAADTGGAIVNPVVAKGDGLQLRRVVTMDNTGGRNARAAGGRITSSRSISAADAQPIWTFETWVYTALTFDTADGFLRLFSAEPGAAEVTENLAIDVGTGAIPTTTDDLCVGARKVGATIDRYFDGELSGVAVYGAALTTTRMNAHRDAAGI